MRKTWLLGFIFVITAVALGVAQTSGAKPTRNLELRLQPEDLQQGLPQTFTFLLVNVSDHDVRVPVVPILDCQSTLYGEIELRLIAPMGQGWSRGCPVNALRGQTILERAQVWSILHAGESMSWRAGKERGLYTDAAAGVYEFWGHYDPAGDLAQRSGLAPPGRHRLSP